VQPKNKKTKKLTTIREQRTAQINTKPGAKKAVDNNTDFLPLTNAHPSLKFNLKQADQA